MKRRFPTAGILLCVAAVFGCGATDRLLSPGVEEIRPGVLAGYLGADRLPDSVALVPPPPAEGSPGMALDLAVSATARRAGPARWEQAIADSDVGFPQAMRIFSCALRFDIAEHSTPALYQLLRRSRTDAAASVDAAKDHYRRPRPFMVNDAPVCTPEKQAGLAGNGSYPSGHAAIGWAWALILAELVPDRSDALLAKGLSFGESRMVCNVHWQSDVQQGQLMAAATVARLHGDADFRRDLALSREEISRVRAAHPVLPECSP